VKQQVKGVLEQLSSRLGPHRFSTVKPRLWVLMYHRILPASDPRYAAEEPGMIVTPDTFRQQLRQLKQLFEMVSLSEWITRRDAQQSLPSRACAVTFDDGWLDNFEYAFPILQEENIPATLFAVSEMIGTTRQFWPNRLARVLSALTPGISLPWLEQFPGYSADKSLDREAIANLILQCKQLPDDELHAHLDNAELQMQLPSVLEPALMNWDQLRTLQQSGLVEIGSHTCNHYRLLESLNQATAAREIINSRQQLEQQLEKSVSLFCYPNGDASNVALKLVGEHYRGAVTTQRGINTATTSPLSLLRIGVHEDVSNTPAKFEARLSGWF